VPEFLTLLAFVPAALALNLTPGADMMFCLGQGIRGGPRAALAADVGISVGAMIHVIIAGIGLGAVVAASPWLFDAIRWIGVGYLLWLAYGALRSGVFPASVKPVVPTRAFRQGLVVNLTNPKVILFVLAFIPQFVDPAQGSILGQFVLFGVILSIGGLLVNGAVGVFAAGLRRRLATSSKFGKAISYVSASIFVVIAMRLAVTERS
jgi:threonine/homoserine/homoserine lactone efflux protein